MLLNRLLFFVSPVFDANVFGFIIPVEYHNKLCV